MSAGAMNINLSFNMPYHINHRSSSQKFPAIQYNREKVVELKVVELRHSKVHLLSCCAANSGIMMVVLLCFMMALCNNNIIMMRDD